MSAPDQALFAALKARFAADSGGSGLATLCKGGFIRARDEIRTPNVPRIEFDPQPMPDIGVSGAKSLRAWFSLNVLHHAGKGLGTGDTPEAAGEIDAIVDRAIDQFDGWTPTLTGWAASAVTVAAPSVLAPIGGLIRRSLRCSTLLRRGTGLSGLLTGRDFTISGFTGYIPLAWQILVDGPVFDGTRDLDTFFRPTLGDDRAVGRARFALTAGTPGRQLLQRRSTISASFTTVTGATAYSDSIVITRVTYSPNLSPGNDQPQECEIDFVISAVGGVLPVWTYA